MIKMKDTWRAMMIVTLGGFAYGVSAQAERKSEEEVTTVISEATAATTTEAVQEAATDPLAILKEREAQVKDVFKRVSPAVVALGSANNAEGWGSGVIVTPNGLILSAGHVTEAIGEDVLIYLADGRELPGKSLGANMNRDAAMVQILADEGATFPHVAIADPDTAQLGDWVVALGHPGGYDPTRPAPLRVGRVTQKQRTKLLITDCTLSGGDSGGALFNLEGQLVGIHSSIASSFSHNIHVAIAVFHKDWERLEKGDNWGELTSLFDEALPGYEERLDSKKNRAVLGASLDKLSRNGVLARKVAPNFPADEAGMKAGDVIIKFGDKDLTTYSDLFPLLGATDPGDQIDLVVRRRGKEVEITVTMGDRRKLMGDN